MLSFEGLGNSQCVKLSDATCKQGKSTGILLYSTHLRLQTVAVDFGAMAAVLATQMGLRTVKTARSVSPRWWRCSDADPQGGSAQPHLTNAKPLDA